MLKPTNQNTKYCYERALEAEQKAANAQDAADRKFWLEREKHWFHLAASYDFTERVTAFIQELRNAPKTPICSNCDVSMRVSRFHSRSEGSTEYHYECPACEAKQRIVHIEAHPFCCRNVR
jgi:hypothetical protein